MTRTVLVHVENSGMPKFCGATVASRTVAAGKTPGKSFSGIRSGCGGHSLSGRVSHDGPSHQSGCAGSSEGGIPLEAGSLGLDSDGTYFQVTDAVVSRIFPTLFSRIFLQLTPPTTAAARGRSRGAVRPNWRYPVFLGILAASADDRANDEKLEGIVRQ